MQFYSPHKLLSGLHYKQFYFCKFDHVLLNKVGSMRDILFAILLTKMI
jgi:hypothetical protein